jgi:GPN-loop GTPase
VARSLEGQLLTECKLVVVNLIDSYALTLPSLYISTLLLSLRTMLQMDLTHINVLTKIDNLHKFPSLPFNLDFYTEVQDLTYLLPSLEAESPMFASGKFQKLNEAVIELVEEFGLVSYEVLAVEDKKSMMSLLQAIDRAGGYAFGGAEGANDSVWQVAIRQGLGQLSASDIQERWVDNKEVWDERERQEAEEEQMRQQQERDLADDMDTVPFDSGVTIRRSKA